jgi:hypothetical protein
MGQSLLFLLLEEEAEGEQAVGEQAGEAEVSEVFPSRQDTLLTSSKAAAILMTPMKKHQNVLLKQRHSAWIRAQGSAGQ